MHSLKIHVAIRAAVRFPASTNLKTSSSSRRIWRRRYLHMQIVDGRAFARRNIRWRGVLKSNLRRKLATAAASAPELARHHLGRCWKRVDAQIIEAVKIESSDWDNSRFTVLVFIVTGFNLCKMTWGTLRRRLDIVKIGYFYPYEVTFYDPKILIINMLKSEI